MERLSTCPNKKDNFNKADKDKRKNNYPANSLGPVSYPPLETFFQHFSRLVNIPVSSF
jgi:hypothetical protein